MAEYKTPGVYIEEKSTMSPSVAGVETAIPAFIGFTESGPKNTPVAIENLLEYQNIFGKGSPLTVNDDGELCGQEYCLFDSMRLFYDNGGADCYVISIGTYDETKSGDIALLYKNAIDKLDEVDDVTMLSYMKDACAALGSFKAKYGVFYCLGNHDMGYYSSGRRGYTGEELLDELRNNNVTVLLDESVLIDDRFYVIGRRDADYGRSDRMDTTDLIKDLDKDKYMIVLDHQPTDYAGEAAAGVDLVLSGHTHGGQLFPLEYIQPLVSQNNNVRGHERHDNTDFIVTDGISDWAVKFRTGCRSEFNLIGITTK